MAAIKLQIDLVKNFIRNPFCDIIHIAVLYIVITINIFIYLFIYFY